LHGSGYLQSTEALKLERNSQTSDFAVAKVKRSTMVDFRKSTIVDFRNSGADGKTSKIYYGRALRVPGGPF
jgi:hypothetical protein